MHNIQNPSILTQSDFYICLCGISKEISDIPFTVIFKWVVKMYFKVGII